MVMEWDTYGTTTKENLDSSNNEVKVHSHSNTPGEIMSKSQSARSVTEPEYHPPFMQEQFSGRNCMRAHTRIEGRGSVACIPEGIPDVGLLAEGETLALDCNLYVYLVKKCSRLLVKIIILIEIFWGVNSERKISFAIHSHHTRTPCTISYSVQIQPRNLIPGISSR